MLRPLNLFNAKPTLKNVNSVVENTESKHVETKTPESKNIEEKLEKITNEIASFIRNSENAYDNHKKELTETLNKYISEMSNKTEEITKKVDIIDQTFLSTKREPVKSINLITEEKPIEKKKETKRYYKLPNDLVEKTKIDYPSLDKKHFDNLFVRDEKVYIKIGIKYVELNTDTYCKYSKTTN